MSSAPLSPDAAQAAPNTDPSIPSTAIATVQEDPNTDLFIDLFGETTDQYPDVRQYLILMGSVPKPETPAPNKRAKLDQDTQDQQAIQRGKERLREAWRNGQGYFLNTKARDYTGQCQDEATPDLGVAWWDDLRRTGSGADPQPVVKLAGGKALDWGHVGGNCVNQSELGSEQFPWYSRGKDAITKDRLVKTNLRCPLPQWEYCLTKPENKQQWANLIRVLYESNIHPAFIAIESDVRLSGITLDFDRNLVLEGMGLLAPEWTDQFSARIDDDEDIVDENDDEFGDIEMTEGGGTRGTEGH